MTIYLLKNRIRTPPSALHDVYVGDSHSMLDRGAIVPEVVKTEMRQSRSVLNVYKTVWNLRRVYLYDAALNSFDFIVYEIRQRYESIPCKWFCTFRSSFFVFVHNDSPLHMYDFILDVHSSAQISLLLIGPNAARRITIVISSSLTCCSNIFMSLSVGMYNFGFTFCGRLVLRLKSGLYTFHYCR